MRIVIPGGTGQVGTILARAFVRDGHEVVVLSRRPGLASWRVVGWDAETLRAWTAELDGADAVINLAGRSVNCRYTATNRQLIKASRIRSTQAVGQAIARAARPPRVWLQASTATIYAHRYEVPNDEATGVLGGLEENAPATWRFSIDVARSWEQAMHEATVPHTRRVLLRSAMVMSPDRGGSSIPCCGSSAGVSGGEAATAGNMSPGFTSTTSSEACSGSSSTTISRAP